METHVMVEMQKKRYWYPPPITLEMMNPNSEKEEADIAEEIAKLSVLYFANILVHFKQFLEEEDILESIGVI